ncbi:MAG: hypothetical protein COV45_07480 [Deltaproteobacteria bacterium CG11_big_fil_rev_8_21_14_0_20_47_16]|nr:MAG: hypothetical protein COV45_07480 [Deltaproteobacteria bacterium CG11_big_fil_rev_8_21_14_0_20_47_16]
MRRAALIIVLGVLLSSVAQAFPNKVSANLSLGLSQAVQFAISSDNASLYVCYSSTFAIVDTGTFALSATQPYDITQDTDTFPQASFVGLMYSSAQNAVYCSQDNGNLIKYDLGNITAAPTLITLAAGKQLGMGVADSVGGNKLFVVDVTDTSVIQYVISTNTATQIPLNDTGLVGNFQVQNIVFSPQSTSDASEVYMSTNLGAIIYFPLGSPAAFAVAVNSENQSLTNASNDQLMGIYPTPDRQYIYVIDKTAINAVQFSISAKSVVSTFTLTPNGNLNQLLITNVTQPTGVYGYVAGSGGISIFDTTNNDVFDEGTTTDDNEPLASTNVGPMVASTDGYIYVSGASGNIGVISDNPWVTINSTTYSGGGSSLGVGETVTVNFQADEAGTYVMRSGGTVAGTGTLLQDSSGNTNGTVTTANTAQDVIIPYDSNSSAFEEGSNSVYFFVTDSAGNVGRRVASISVDTPPPAVSVLSSSFGNTRAYINFVRLTQNDINHYNVYADTDPVLVTTKSTVAATVTQGSDSVLTGVVGGLTNGTLYYLAIEGVDDSGNVGPRTNTFSGGLEITATPEQTVGPAGYTGESGCSLISNAEQSTSFNFYWMGFLLVLAIWRLRLRRAVVIMLMPLVILSMQSKAIAGDFTEHSTIEVPQSPFIKYGWFVDAKLSLWQPTASTTKVFFPAFYNLQGMVEGGFLFNERIGAEVGVGMFYKTGSAIGATSGAVSQDSFSLMVFPVTVGGSYHFLYSRKQWVAPYVRGGLEFDVFRENDSGSKIYGVKKGLYGGAGLQIPVTHWLDESFAESKKETQVYIILEGMYKWVNNFGGGGLNLSGALYSLGCLFTF